MNPDDQKSSSNGESKEQSLTEDRMAELADPEGIKLSDEALALVTDDVDDFASITDDGEVLAGDPEWEDAEVIDRDVKPASDDGEFCSVNEAAELAGKSIPTIYYWIKRGKVRRQWMDNRWQLAKDDVLALRDEFATTKDPDMIDLTAEEAAKVAGCSVSTLYRAAASGKIKRRRDPGSRVLFVREDVEAFKAEREAAEVVEQD